MNSDKRHKWTRYKDKIVCKYCGVVMNDTNQIKTCRLRVKIQKRGEK